MQKRRHFSSYDPVDKDIHLNKNEFYLVIFIENIDHEN